MRDMRRAFGDSRVNRQLRWILIVYLVVVGVLVTYNARSVARQRGAALIVNVAARQRALAERYVKDVVLEMNGGAADSRQDGLELLTNDEALLHGGDVLPVQGADGSVTIPPASTEPGVVAKLEEEHRLVEELLETGHRLLALPTGDPRVPAALLDLRVAGGQVTSVSNDAVGQMTSDSERAMFRLVAAVVGLGVLGAAVAVAMGLLLHRTERKRSARFRSLVDNASDLITVVDESMVIRYQSPSVVRLVGVESNHLMDTSYLDLVEPDDRAHVAALLSDLAGSSDGIATAQYRVKHADGASRYVESIISSRMSDPSLRGLVLNSRDVTDRKSLEDELAHRAFHDSLTGLSNRAVFRDRVEHALALAGRQGRSITVLLLDLDGFKTINDSLGHDAGDELLVGVAGRLLATSRSSDTVARLGGDEFAILLEDAADSDRATASADRVLAGLEQPFEVHGRQVFMRASVGIAISEGLDDTDDLVRNADTAMYAAKSAGKGRSEFFRPDMHEHAMARFEVQADLERAVTRHEFLLQYQPIVDLMSERVHGVEALVRWMHPTRGLLPPSEFIRVAEETGLIVPIGDWVLGEACRQTVALRESFPSADLWVSVNLSARQLLEADLVERVASVLASTSLDPAALTLELTEGSLMQDVTTTIVKLRDLKALGVRLAIDDFGTGSSSLGYLRHFPIDVLKIDKSFVDELDQTGAEGPALVGAIIEMARTLGLETVAEGIELDGQRSDLRTAGCRSGQGFLFARPLDPSLLENLLQRSDAPLPSL